MQPVKAYFKTVMVNCSYRLDDQFQHYDYDVARHICKMAKQFKVQLKSKIFDGSDLITVLNFLLAFQVACNRMAFMRTRPCGHSTPFMKKPDGAALSAKTFLTSSSWPHQERKLTSYCQAVRYLLNTYATDDITFEADAHIINYRQLQNFNALDYLQSLWKKALRCGPVYDEYQLKSTCIEALLSSIHQSARSYWAKNSGSSLQELARHAL